MVAIGRFGFKSRRQLLTRRTMFLDQRTETASLLARLLELATNGLRRSSLLRSFRFRARRLSRIDLRPSG